MSEHHDSGSGELQAFELHGARIGVRILGVEAERASALLAEALPVGARPIAAEALDEVCEVREGSGRPLLHELASVLDFAVAEHATERVFLHAGVVAWEGRAIVVPGRSLSGKTTLTAALVRAGATFLSDEFAPIDREGRVWPHPRPLGIRDPGSVEPGRPVPAEQLGFEPGSEPLPVGLIVHTRHVAGASWRPSTLDAGEALLRVLDNAVVAQTRPELALFFLAPIAGRTRVLDGVRGDADEAAAQILLAAGSPSLGSPSETVACEVPEGLDLGGLRHLLVRLVLAARHAAVPTGTGGWVAPRLALGSIPGEAARSVGDRRGEARRWSSLYDLAALAAGTGVVVTDLDGDAAADGGGDRIEVAGDLDAGALVDARRPDAPDGRAGVVAVGVDRIGWGAAYGSLGFWSVIDALRPAADVRDRAERLRPDGPFLGVHWRRGSDARVRPDISPSAGVAAEQIAAIALEQSLLTVVVGGDAGSDELFALRAVLDCVRPRLRVIVLSDVGPDGPADVRQQLVEDSVLAESTWFVGTRSWARSAGVREGRVASGRWAPEASWTVLCGDAHHPPRLDDADLGPIWALPDLRR